MSEPIPEDAPHEAIDEFLAAFPDAHEDDARKAWAAARMQRALPTVDDVIDRRGVAAPPVAVERPPRPGVDAAVRRAGRSQAVSVRDLAQAGLPGAQVVDHAQLAGQRLVAAGLLPVRPALGAHAVRRAGV